MQAYAGGTGTIKLEFKEVTNLRDTTKATLTAGVFLEIECLLWEHRFEWDFINRQIFPKVETTEESLMKVTRDDLRFIEPLQGVVAYSANPATYKSNVQRYCAPQIVELNSGKILMIYIDDVSSRSDENRTALMYSIYDGAS